MLTPLPVTYHEFASLREDGCLYVDKTAYMLRMIQDRLKYVFLARPRRFGKSLTLSTLKAMFQGRSELFHGLAAEEWVKEQAKHPAPVVQIDMSRTLATEGPDVFRKSLMKRLILQVRPWNLRPENDDTLEDFTERLLYEISERDGGLVLLIDEYDTPLLDNIADSDAANKIRSTLRSFYRTIKSCEEYLRFVMITGISKFSKVGIFSGMNNLQDISMTEDYGELCGYTQKELESYFCDWIERMAQKDSCTSADIVERLKEYYDGFSFDGVHKVYNPWSVMNCLYVMQLNNYWFNSGSPSFLSSYMRQHKCQLPEEFTGIKVAPNFMETHEIECSAPEAMLCQSGYLTIVNRDPATGFLTLDYPNKEVRDSMFQLYAENIYGVSQVPDRATAMRDGLTSGNFDAVMATFSEALKGVPYSDFQPLHEGLFCAIFMSILRIIGVECLGEVQTSSGRSDVTVLLDKRVYILEFKLLRGKCTRERLDAKLDEALRQIAEHDYMAPYKDDRRELTCAGVVIDARKHVVAGWKNLSLRRHSL